LVSHYPAKSGPPKGDRGAFLQRSPGAKVLRKSEAHNVEIADYHRG
jgi:hypothetical protein